MRRAALAVLLLAVAGCADPKMPDAPLIRIRTEVREVELGKGFPLDVVRVYEKAGDPPIWTDEYLEPLSLRLLGTETREDDRFVMETRRYTAYAFALGSVTVPALSDADVPLEIRVRAALDPETPGPAELPGGPLREPFRWWIPAAVLLALGASVAWLLGRRRVPAPEPGAVEAPPPVRVESATDRALARIAALRGADPGNHEEQQVFHLEVSAILRDFLAERFDFAANEKTTEEILAHRPDEERSGLSAALGPCDLVKFARHHPDRDGRSATLDAAEAFVSEAP